MQGWIRVQKSESRRRRKAPNSTRQSAASASTDQIRMDSGLYLATRSTASTHRRSTRREWGLLIFRTTKYLKDQTRMCTKREIIPSPPQHQASIPHARYLGYISSSLPSSPLYLSSAPVLQQTQRLTHRSKPPAW